ncbi:MAG: hypothetical protein AMXMBFR84_37810 [Candidatus Hydrogenedentota bacterium]
MSSPSTNVDLRPDITGSLEKFDVQANEAGYIASRVLPPKDVDTQSGTFGVIPIKELLKQASTERASNGHYNRIGFEFTDDSWATKEIGLEVRVDERNKNMYSRYFDDQLVAARLSRSTVLKRYEMLVAAAIFNTNTWTPTAVSTEWSNNASGVPITDVTAAKKRVRAATGMLPNAIIMNWIVFENLRNNAQIIDRIESGGAGQMAKPADITREMIARCFDLEEVIVAGGMTNTANDADVAVLADIWSSEYCALARVARTNNIEEACVGRTFHWTEDGSSIGTTFESYDEPQSRSMIVRNRMEVQAKILYTECLDLLSNITA